MPFHDDAGGGHHDRPDLAGEYAANHRIQQVSLAVFLSLWILDSFILGLTTFPAPLVPLPVRAASGLLLIVLSLWMLRSSLNAVFGEVREEPKVITEGFFSVVRHPVYLGVVLLYLGLLVMTFSMLALCAWAAVTAAYYYISLKEEELLVEKFGVEYEEYRRRVPMLLPVPAFGPKH